MHNVVFAGFSAEALGKRLLQSEAKVVFTADRVTLDDLLLLLKTNLSLVVCTVHYTYLCFGVPSKYYKVLTIWDNLFWLLWVSRAWHLYKILMGS